MATEPNSEFLFLLRREKVGDDVMGRLTEAGVVSVKLLANLAKDADDLRAIAESDLGLGGTDLATRVKMASLICAYSSARARAAEFDKVDAEREVLDRPKVLLVSEYDGMKTAFEKTHWVLSLEKSPAKSMVEAMLKNIETRQMRAEKLSDVLNAKQDDGGEFKPTWTADGVWKAMKMVSPVPLPANTEQLRSRLALLGVCWTFCSYQQTANPVLQAMKPSLWSEYADYLLGEQVAGLRAKTADGEYTSAPSWALVLSYEYEVRSKAYETSRGGQALEKALKEAWKDELVYRRYFLTPLTLEGAPGRKRPSEGEPQWSGAWGDGGGRPKWEKGSSKGKGTSKGKGKGEKGQGKGKKKGKKGVFGSCFAFNNPNESCKAGSKNCKFDHKCSNCGKPNVPVYQCDCQKDGVLAA